MAEGPRMLEGYRVLDFSHFVAAATCARILGELGAEVIKVERSLEGDHVRKLGLGRDGMSTYFFQHNHCKKSLAIDLRKPRARQLLTALIPKIDVVVENFAPGVIADMGFGYEALRRINPKIIMASVSLGGQQGPLRDKPGYDYLGAAYAGVVDLLGEPDHVPIVPPLAIGDTSTGVALAMAVGFALLHRERTGEGQYIDASLIDTYFHMHELTVPVVSLRPGRFQPKRGGRLHPTGAPIGVYPVNGGCILIAVQAHEMERLWRALGRPELASDPRFATNRERMKNRELLTQIIEQWLAGFPDRDSALAALERERVPCAPVLKVEEAMAHPHLRQRNTVRRVRDEGLGEFDIPGMPVRFSAWPQRSDLRAPRLGADNDWVMGELLGLSSSEIAALYADGVLLRAEKPTTS